MAGWKCTGPTLLTEGCFEEMIEEGVEATDNHGHHFKTFWNGKERNYESYTACFHSAVMAAARLFMSEKPIHGR